MEGNIVVNRDISPFITMLFSIWKSPWHSLLINEQFLLLPQYFRLFSLINLSFIDSFKAVCCRIVVCVIGLTLLPHTTILQQMTLNIFFQNIDNLYNWMDNLWLKVDKIVAKGEISLSPQFFRIFTNQPFIFRYFP